MTTAEQIAIRDSMLAGYGKRTKQVEKDREARNRQMAEAVDKLSKL